MEEEDNTIEIERSGWDELLSNVGFILIVLTLLFCHLSCNNQLKLKISKNEVSIELNSNKILESNNGEK